MLAATSCYSSEDAAGVLVLLDVLEVLELLSAFGLSSVEAASVLPSSLPLEELDPPDLPELRLSVTYHPLPLKMTPTGCSTRRMGP